MRITSPRIDDNIGDRISEALWAESSIEARSIDVHVLHGSVLLTGSVPSERDRIAAGQLVADLLCVEEVHNALVAGVAEMTLDELWDNLLDHIDGAPAVPRTDPLPVIGRRRAVSSELQDAGLDVVWSD